MEVSQLFQGEVKDLNHNFSKVLDLFMFIKHAIIKSMVSQLARLSQDSTQLSQILEFR